MTLQHLIVSLMQLQGKHNGSHDLFSDLFDLLRDVLPKDGPEAQPRLPNYRRVRELMTASANAEMAQFALCPRDCALRSIDGLSPEALSALKQERCDKCGLKYSENGKEFDKVRNNTSGGSAADHDRLHPRIPAA